MKKNPFGVNYCKHWDALKGKQNDNLIFKFY